MKLAAFLCAALVGMASVAFGQQSLTKLPPLPDGPLIRLRAPEVSRWMVTFNPQRAGNTEAVEESGQPSTAGRVSFSKRVVYTKNKDLILEQTLVPSRPVRDRWIIGDYQYSKNAETKRYLPYTAKSFASGVPNPYFYVDFSKTDFPGIEWITKESYAGIQKVMKRDCIIFRQTGDGDATAYVDLATRYPVMLRRKGDTVLYEFQRPAQISLPAEIQEDLKSRAPSIPPKP